jgi:hypothetical protein
MRPRTPGFRAVCRWPFDAASLAGSSSALAALWCRWPLRIESVPHFAKSLGNRWLDRDKITEKIVGASRGNSP